ncbi:SAM-dependent methyltransferase [Actinoplanes sp. NPDC049596]|uniref:class I SAM-dependent methyltransferase n=1 Tax=unclassified Actinoplanes TaxID=2626549 RepID=UPI0034293986
MTADGAERTASGAGMMRALEAHAPQPLFDDPLAERFLTGWPAYVTRHRVLRRVFLSLLERAGPGFYGAVVCRTRAIDDACRQALAQGIEQVVIIGAGMDTRPYRMPEMAAASVVELDLPTVQKAKKTAVVRVLDALPAHVRYAPIDLTKQPVDAGFDQPVLLLCEAVSMYLPREAAEKLLTYAGGQPAGSRFVLTYLPQAVAADPRHGGWARRLHWRTAFDPAELQDRLAGQGLSVLADLGAEEYQEQLLRPLGRTLAVFPGERTVIASKNHH